MTAFVVCQGSSLAAGGLIECREPPIAASTSQGGRNDNTKIRVRVPAGPRVAREPRLRARQCSAAQYRWNRASLWEAGRTHRRDVQGLVSAIGLVRQGREPRN